MIKDIGNGIKYNIVGKISTIVMGLLVSIIIIRESGASEYGSFIFVTFIFANLTPLYSLGLNIPLTRYVSEYKVKGEFGKIRTLVVRSLEWKLIAWLILSPIVLIIWFYKYPATFIISLILVLTMFLTSISSTFISTLESFYEQKLLNIAEFIKNLIIISLLLISVKFTHNIAVFFIIQLISLVVQCFILNNKIKSKIDLSPRDINEDIRRIAKFSISSIIGSIISYITTDKSEVYFLEAYRTKEEVAYYGLAYDFALRIPSVMTIIIGSLHIVSMTDAYTRDPSKLALIARKMETFLLLFGIPICIWNFMEAQNFILILYGPTMIEAVFPLKIILIFTILNTLLFPVNSIIAALERQPYATLIGAVFASIDILISFLLIPTYGITGAIVSKSILFTISIIFWGVCSYKWIGNFIPARSLIKFLISAIPMALILYITGDICRNPGYLIFFSCISLICYLIMLKIVKALSHSDKEIISKMELPVISNISHLI